MRKRIIWVCLSCRRCVVCEPEIITWLFFFIFRKRESFVCRIISRITRDALCVTQHGRTHEFITPGRITTLGPASANRTGRTKTHPPQVTFIIIQLFYTCVSKLLTVIPYIKRKYLLSYYQNIR